MYQSRTATGNAIANATVPVMDAFCAGEKNAYTTLDASGLSVGLPAGLMGNSEVGHLNIGAGRVVYQVTLIRICLQSLILHLWVHIDRAYPGVSIA